MSQELYEQIKSKRRYPALDVHHWDRQPKEQWINTRKRIYKRDQGLCQSPESALPKIHNLCEREVKLNECHIDHIKPLISGGSNHASNLRVLCPVCHGLRSDSKHLGMKTSMVSKNVLPMNWKQYLWD